MSDKLTVATAPKTATFQMRINPEIKAQLEDYFAQCGMTLSNAINVDTVLEYWMAKEMNFNHGKTGDVTLRLLFSTTLLSLLQGTLVHSIRM